MHHTIKMTLKFDRINRINQKQHLLNQRKLVNYNNIIELLEIYFK
jgi:hypothetical protein